MRERRFRHPPVIAYHSIEELDPTGSGAAVFERQMSYLARSGYRTLSSGEFVRAVESGEWPARSLLLTFDDGYLDFAADALPVLVASGLSATVFLISDVLERGPQEWLGPRPAYKAPLMGWSEVRALRGKGVSFGSHGASHRVYGPALSEEFAREAAHSKAVLEAGLGEAVELFAYPYGECSQAAKSAVQAAGYAAAFALKTRSPDRFEIPRREPAPREGTLRFALRASSAYPAMSRASHLLPPRG